MEEILLNIGLFLLKFIVGIISAAISIFLSIKLFDKLTGKINEWEEVKKGNASVGLFLLGIILANSLIIEKGVGQITNGISLSIPTQTMVMLLLVNIANLLLTIICSILSTYISFWVFTTITIDIDEEKELKKGNLAIGFILLAVFVAVSVIIRSAVSGFVDFLNAEIIIKALAG